MLIYDFNGFSLENLIALRIFTSEFDRSVERSPSKRKYSLHKPVFSAHFSGIKKPFLNE